MEKLTAVEQDCFVIINNIPKEYHASHLRKFFSFFIESKGFICFHYRHRPEVQKPSVVNHDSKDLSRRVSNCCIVKVNPDRVDDFVKSYNGEHWINDKGEMMTCCFIKKIHVSESKSSEIKFSGSNLCKKGTVSSSLPLDRETFSKEDLESLIEMHPPKFMPNGNVGTTSEHFLAEIKRCRLPPTLITKLGLQFPRCRSRKIYSTVPFEYCKKRIKNYKPNPKVEKVFHKQPWGACVEKYSTFYEKEKDDSDSEGEEWDRHAALHDDITSQDRTKERLFEDKIELKWEKGGSGLVFYTDAQYWDRQEGDFDAKTSDDWDIDTRIYRHSGPDNDRDMHDLVRMRLEERVRDGTETDMDQMFDFAAFEKYSTGFGRKVLESQGWKQGQGVGKNASGIAEPIPNDGQRPFDKKGFGYRGPKLNRHPIRNKRKRNTEDDNDDRVFISTVYDNPLESDPPESVLTSSSFARLKYLQSFLKERS